MTHNYLIQSLPLPLYRHAHTLKNRHTHTHTCSRTHTHTYTHVHKHTNCTCTHIHAHPRTCTCTHTYTRTHTHTSTLMHTHTHTQSHNPLLPSLSTRRMDKDRKRTRQKVQQDEVEESPGIPDRGMDIRHPRLPFRTHRESESVDQLVTHLIT